MAYPPSPLPTNATDGTSPTDTTPTAVLTAAELNGIAAAVNDIVTELGPNPSGASATVGARLDGIEADVDALGSGSIPDGSVSTAKLANGAVTAAKVAADVATQAELDAETAARTAAIAGLSGTYAPKAALWAAGAEYVVGQLVISSGTLYRCTTAHTAGGSFASGNFTSIGGGGGGATVTLDSDGTLIVDGTTVELGTDAEIAAAIAAAVSPKANDSAVVHLTGAEAIAGVKTFSSPPVVPTATAAGNPITKAQFDALVTSGAGIKRTYGAQGDMRVVTDATVTAASTTITSPTAAFVAGDVGKTIGIPYAGADNGTAVIGQTHVTTIASVTNSTTAVLAVAPIKSIAGPRTVTDAAISSGGNSVTSATASFTVTDIGKKLVIPGAGRPTSTGINESLTTWITAVPSGTTATVSIRASATVSARTVTIPGAWVGIGTNDTAAFQAAAAAKGAIEIEPGRYLITEEITCNSDTTWWGYGTGRSILSPVMTTGSAFRYEGGAALGTQRRNITFRDFEIDCSGVRTNTYSTVNKGLYLTNVRGLVLERMYVHDTSATAVGCDFLPGSYMVGNTVDRGGAQVPEFGGGTGGGSGFGIGTGLWTVEDVYIAGNTVRYCGNNGIFSETQTTVLSKGVRIIGNYVSDCTFGISDRGCDGTIISDNIVVDCIYGIYMHGGIGSTTKYSTNTMVQNNHLDGSRIYIKYNSGHMTVINNTVTRATQAAIELELVAGSTCDSVTIEDNRLLDIQALTRGIWLRTAGAKISRVFIAKNKIKDPAASASPRPAIVSEINADTMHVRDNAIWDTRTPPGMSYGLQLTAGTIGRLVFDGNDIENPATAASDLSGAAITTTVTHFNP